MKYCTYPTEKQVKTFNTLLEKIRCSALLEHIDMINTEMLEDWHAKENGAYQVFRVKGIKTPDWFCSEHSQDYVNEGTTVTIIEIPKKIFLQACENYCQAIERYCTEDGEHLTNWAIECDILDSYGITNEGYKRWKTVQNI